MCAQATADILTSDQAHVTHFVSSFTLLPQVPHHPMTVDPSVPFVYLFFVITRDPGITHLSCLSPGVVPRCSFAYVLCSISV